MKFKRIIDLKAILKRKSAFLLGPRLVGKTTLYLEQLKADRVYNLLNAQTLKKIIVHPTTIYDECEKSGETIVLDEVQKIPMILDDVQRCIQEKNTTFLLTGSSARKLKKTNTNLLGGRATQVELLPLIFHEIPDFNLVRYLNHGGIPKFYLAPESEINLELDDYVALYLKEEIVAESVTRNLEGFSKFLEVMALHSGDELIIENFSSDCAVKATTFKNYLEVLKDTLIGFEVQPFLKTKKRKAITRSKFFLFDIGVTNYLAHRGQILPKSESFGKAFEHFIAMELRAFIKYKRKNYSLSYWRSTGANEVDFILDDWLAIEVKSTDQVLDRHLSGLKALKEENIVKKYCVVAQVDTPSQRDGIMILPYQVFIKKLWEETL